VQSCVLPFFFASRRRHTRSKRDWSSDVCSSDLPRTAGFRRLMAGLFFAGVATFAQLYSPQGLLPLISADLDVTADQAALLISARSEERRVGQARRSRRGAGRGGACEMGRESWGE